MSRINPSTKLVAYVARRILGRTGTKVQSNPSGTCTAVTIGGKTVCGVYLPSEGSMEDLIDDLRWAARTVAEGGGGQIMGYFNSKEGSSRRETVEN